MTRNQRALLAATTLATAVTRWFALARSPWDWDEMLFILAMRHYNVADHQPHPPGFPIWIFFGDLVHALGLSEFHALQLLSFLAAVAIVPATFALCRALRMPFATSLAAAALLAFFPNVWFFGGTAFSDVPSMTLVVAALALLLGDRYYAGVVVLAVAAGIRPQNLLIGAVPLLLASVRRPKRDVVIAALIGMAIVGVSYGVAIEKTGWSAYRDAVRMHSEYIAKIDSFRSPLRPPLRSVFLDFFVRPYRMPAINIAVALFAAIALVARRRHTLIALAAFGPFCVFAWLMLDHFSASRFSIGYAPLIALLAADGMDVVARKFCGVIASILVIAMAIWTWPALRVVHTTDSPPVAAIDWIRAHADRRTPIDVHPGIGPHAQVLMPERDLRYFLEPPALWTSEPAPIFLREGVGAFHFVRPRGHLWWLTRQRYFDVSITPVTQRVRFRSGFYDEEGDANVRWRWMGARGTIDLPPLPDAHLRLALYVPLDLFRAQPNIEVKLNGATIARVRATTPNVEIERDVGAGSELTIETDHALKPPNDPRVLGLRLNVLEWRARK